MPACVCVLYSYCSYTILLLLYSYLLTHTMCQVFRSIGYKSVKVDKDIPFDHNKGVVLNEKGRIVSGEPLSHWRGWVCTSIFIICIVCSPFPSHLLPCWRVKSLEAQFQVRRHCSLCHTHAVISSSISFASHASHHPSPLGEGHTTPDYSFAWFPPECIMACASGLLWCCPYVCLQVCLL